MCFSATSSFVSSALLCGAGLASLKYAGWEQKAFAAVPFVFSGQQFCEGVLWLAHTKQYFLPLQSEFTFAFLVFAQVVWPFWSPYSIFRMEKKSFKRNLLLACTILGALAAVYLLYCLLNYPVYSEISDQHIKYTLDYPVSQRSFFSILYFIPTVLPALISGVKRMRIIGLLILCSFFTAKIYFNEYLLSVWCFFAALISALVVVVILESRRMVLPSVRRI